MRLTSLTPLLVLVACTSATSSEPPGAALPPPEGAECTVPAGCVHYSPPTGCAPGQTCVGQNRCVDLTVSGLGVCRNPRSLGGKCDDGTPCVPPLQCSIAGATAGTCAPVEEVGLGDGCDSRTQQCKAGLVCANGRCAEVVGVGASCADPLHVCVFRAQEGAFSWLVHCDVEKGICSIPAPVGAFCTGDSTSPDCATGGYCEGGHCVVARPEGAACKQEQECLSMRCNGMCMPPFKLSGDPCVQPQECSSGFCTNGHCL